MRQDRGLMPAVPSRHSRLLFSGLDLVHLVAFYEQCVRASVAVLAFLLPPSLVEVF